MKLKYERGKQKLSSFHLFHYHFSGIENLKKPNSTAIFIILEIMTSFDILRSLL